MGLGGWWVVGEGGVGWVGGRREGGVGWVGGRREGVCAREGMGWGAVGWGVDDKERWRRGVCGGSAGRQRGERACVQPRRAAALPRPAPSSSPPPPLTFSICTMASFWNTSGSKGQVLAREPFTRSHCLARLGMWPLCGRGRE